MRILLSIWVRPSRTLFRPEGGVKGKMLSMLSGWTDESFPISLS